MTYLHEREGIYGAATTVEQGACLGALAMNGIESDISSQEEGHTGYYLPEHEFQALEKKLVSRIKEQEGETVSIAWIDSKSPYADLARTLEAKEFPEIPELMHDYEEVSKFLTLVDTREGVDRIVHAFRLSSRGFQEHAVVDHKEGFGIALVDDLINSGQGVEIEEFLDFYESQGININKCISVETNFRVGEKVESAFGVPTSMLGYVAVFRTIERAMDGQRDGAVFAHLNKPAVMSLRMSGVEYEPFVGRSDLQTPSVGPKKFDKKYKPMVVTPTDKNMAVFEALNAIAVPEIEF